MIPLIDQILKADQKMRHEEAKRARLVAEARRGARQDARTHLWRWDVEPGMEEAFDDLLGWMLSSQQDADAKTESAAKDTPICGKREVPGETAPARRAASPWAVCAALCCGRAY